jgi:hypothetical protein
MFIERSSARIRTVRTLFVLLGLVPCAGLCGWAVLRHSSFHRRAIELRCEQAFGMPVRIGRVEHVRPDALRLHGCELVAADGEAVVTAPVVDLESSPTEVRLRVGRIACSPRLARAATDLVHQWLGQPARFPLDCVVDVGELSWLATTTSPAPGKDGIGRFLGLRIECVAAEGGRAVRLSGGGSADGAARTDELRVLTTTAAATAAGPPALRVEVTGALATPVPVAILEACLGCDAGALSCGADAVVSGRIDSTCEGGRWSGTAAGRIEGIDLAAASAWLPHRMSGEASLAIERIDWARGRIAGCDCRLVATRGVVEQPLLDALVTGLGCRPGPEYRTAIGERSRAFDQVACRLRIGPSGVDLRADSGARAAIAVVRGGAILEEPAAAVPLERVAWLLSPPTSVAVPASQATRWLLGAFAEEMLPGGTEAAVRKHSEQAVRPTTRSDF